MAECIFDGPMLKDTFIELMDINFVRCKMIDYGETIFIFGLQTLLPLGVDEIEEKQHQYVLLEISNRKMTTFLLDDELVRDSIDIYYLHKDLFVTFSRDYGQVYQTVWKLNRNTKQLENLFCRIISFPVTENFAISTSSFPSSGYVLVSCVQYDDDVSSSNIISCGMRLVAANPLQIKKFPDIFLDKEVAKLEKKCRRRNVEITSQPVISADGIYFLLDNVDESKERRIGSITKEKEKTKVEIFDIKGREEFKWFLLSEPFIYQLNDSYSNGIRWTPYILYKPSRWRLILENWSDWMCQLAFRYIGRPLEWFAKYDNGYLFYQFLRLYWYIVENTCVTIDGSNLTLGLTVVNFKGKHIRRFRIGDQMKFPLITGNVLTAASPHGDLLVAELSDHGRLRITRFRNPYRVPKLLEIAYEMCKEMYPSTTDKLRNITGVCRCFM